MVSGYVAEPFTFTTALNHILLPAAIVVPLKFDVMEAAEEELPQAITWFVDNDNKMTILKVMNFFMN